MAVSLAWSTARLWPWTTTGPTPIRARRPPPPLPPGRGRGAPPPARRGCSAFTLAGPGAGRPRPRPPGRQRPAAAPPPRRAGAARVERQRVPPRRRVARPHLRTLTPLRIDPSARRGRRRHRAPRGGADGDLGGGGRSPATRSAISGTGRGYAIDADGAAYLLAGDESALPAISTILEALPADGRRCRWSSRSATPRPSSTSPGRAGSRCPGTCRRRRRAPRRRAGGGGRRPRRSSPGRGSGWPARPPRCSASAATCSTRSALPRGQCTVRGYWKHGRAGDLTLRRSRRRQPEPHGGRGAEGPPALGALRRAPPS